jgi:hypothetical protein
MKAMETQLNDAQSLLEQERKQWQTEKDQQNKTIVDLNAKVIIVSC